MWQEAADTSLAADAEFDQFVQTVTALWPSYKCTRESLNGTWLRLRQCSTDEIQAALREHRDADPDATKPSWKDVFGRLRSSESGDAWQKFLTRRRKILRDAGYESWERDATDEEIFHEALYSWAGSVVSYQRSEGSDGTSRLVPRLKINQYVCDSFVEGWLRYFAERGLSPPFWLASYRSGTPMEPVVDAANDLPF